MRYIGRWYDEIEEYPDDWNYMNWCYVLEGHTGKRKGTVYPAEGGYRVVLEQYDMTPEFREEVEVHTREEAIETVETFLGGEE